MRTNSPAVVVQKSPLVGDVGADPWGILSGAWVNDAEGDVVIAPEKSAPLAEMVVPPRKVKAPASVIRRLSAPSALFRSEIEVAPGTILEVVPP